MSADMFLKLFFVWLHLIGERLKEQETGNKKDRMRREAGLSIARLRKG